jgi:aminoglycoside phosphotransferase (APT) family kinase protein
MDSPYLGKLDYTDPLYEILISHVCPGVNDPHFHVNRMSSRRVYKYTEEKTRIAIVGKFFNLDDPRQERILRIKGEYDNLRKIRAYGFDTFPNYVVRPIARDERIGLALIEEYIDGRNLDYYLKKAIYEGDGFSLRAGLARLAFFLYALHARTEKKSSADLDYVCAYFRKVICKLFRQRVISQGDERTYLKLMDKWLSRTLLQKAKGVIVHGDATPTNFIFTKKGDVVAIDLERMKNGDMAYDVGMVCGELKHAFLWRTGSPFASEPFISHFLLMYSNHFRDPKKAFRDVTFRNPFYMALAELRIARNDYLDWDYRKRLAHEALECLKWGLKLK